MVILCHTTYLKLYFQGHANAILKTIEDQTQCSDTSIHSDNTFVDTVNSYLEVVIYSDSYSVAECGNTDNVHENIPVITNKER